MKDSFSTVLNANKTLVMSLIGISKLKNKENTYNLLKEINQQKKRPDFIADLSIHKLTKEETLWYKTIHETDSFATTLPCYYVNKQNYTINRNELLDSTIEQMEEGVKLITIHPTPSRKLYELSQRRLVPCTSRGGNIILKDLINNKSNDINAYQEILPELIKHAKKNNTILSIGASYRSSNIFDSLDAVQLEEIKIQLELGINMRKNGISVIIESPGHASPKNILKVAKIFKKDNFPLMPLGPIITDTGIGMDHITAAIGSTLLGINSNVKIIAAVTAEEHTGSVPSDLAIINALETAKMTAHIIDMYKYEDYEDDYKIATSRAENNTCVYEQDIEGCSRCAELCPLID